ncbi:methylamine utilization protein MauE [Rhodovulum euryhalinum]|uniref:Methylamine utilization protein MauE n=2 Tax=Rhodovulum euryhalinum TaxID=35805 RepID=A0A4R2KGI5_9RHOB|nr:methylamine utilization protein MauE [Rhodovulum euryhalinum]
MNWAELAALASAAVATFTAIFFARAAWHKAWDFWAFTGFVADYRLLPARAVVPAAGAILLIETLVVLAMLVPGARVPGLVTGAVMVAAYGAAIAANLARGHTRIECGCGGAPQPLGPALVVRNAGLAALMLAGGAGADGILGLAGAGAAIAAGGALFITYLLFDQIISNAADPVARRS